MKFNSNIREHAVSQYSRKQNLLDLQKLWSLGNQQKSLYQIVFEQFNLKKDKTILDLGAGIGKLWLETLLLFSEDFHVVLSDFSQAMLYEAKPNLKQNEDVFGSLNFIQNDAQFIPFKHLTFDLVIAGHILYHVPDINQAVKEIKHILNPDGKLIATTVLKDHIQELAKLEKIAGNPHHNKKKVIFSEFQINSGKKILEENLLLNLLILKSSREIGVNC
ncbi:MAG: hypothetical protein BAJALOKI2v1_350008 [Promethearchaeota archaeon]|nr:MAG: hypothetical protein BAJALOKI2v1_350008 [Candidatus Lokiarchaeota archaeon]